MSQVKVNKVNEGRVIDNNFVNFIHRGYSWSKSMKLVPSHTCNLKCRYCSLSCKDMANETTLTLEDQQAIIKAWRKLGRSKIYFGGGGYGEPLQCGHLEKLVASAKHEGYHPITVITNGLGLQKRIQGLRDAGLNNITISLDTLSPVVYRELCGADAHEEVVGAITEAVKVFDKVKISMVVMKLINEWEIPRMLTFAQYLGCWIQLGELVTLDPKDQFYIDNYNPLDKWCDILRELAHSYYVQKVEKRHFYELDTSVVQIKSTRMFPEHTIAEDAPIIRPDGKMIYLSHDATFFDYQTFSGSKDPDSLAQAIQKEYGERLKFFKLEHLGTIASLGSHAMASW